MFDIYNMARERIGILQNYDSVQWLENYQSAGEVKIEAHFTENNLDMLIDGNRLYNHDSDTVARICNIERTRTETENLIIVRAELTAEMLSDRVVMATENVTTVETGMYTIYRNNRRNLPIAISNAKGFPEKVDMEITWNSVLEAQERLAEVSGLGFKVIFNPDTGAETFVVYKGIDRTSQQSNNYIGYFGTDVESIENISVISGTDEYKNVAVVAGAGEGAARVVRIVSTGKFDGEARREMYVDARDLQPEYQEAKPTGQTDEHGNPLYTYETKRHSPAKYNAILDDRGREKLAEHLRTFSITCDVTQNNVKYGIDYHLGDRMPVRLPEYGFHATARISSANLIYEQGMGNRIVVLLSDFIL